MDNVNQQDVVLALCKLNNFQYGDVWIHLRKTVPPHLGISEEFFQVGMDKIKETLRAWDMRGIIAVDSTVTKKNPDGKAKVVGFVLYQIHRETKNELEVLFLLVSKSYRNKHHATNMMKMLEDRHLFKSNAVSAEMSRGMAEIVAILKGRAEDGSFIMGKRTATDLDVYSKMPVDDFTNGEKMDGHLFSTPGNDLVHLFTARVQREGTVMEFYRKLGYEDKSHLPGWRQMKMQENDVDDVIMMRAGPRTCIEVGKGRCPWAGIGATST